jgi:ATP-dependent DNA helicase Rep
MQNLNLEQITAIKHISGPLLVLAGAGSGKTGVITAKIAYLIKECSIKPNKVFAVTFTNKAAREMGERVKKQMGADAKGVKISTFHTFGYNFIKREYKKLGFKSNISLYDQEDSCRLIQEISHIEDKEKLNDLQKNISKLKGQAITLDKLVGYGNDPSLIALFQEYQRILRSYNAVDFDDLIYLPIQLLQSCSETLEHWQNQVQYLLVDEYQDTNQAQYQLVKLLTRLSGRLTVVGDDHQSIYSWRGAAPENLKLLQQDFPHLTIIKLEQNYRSSRYILSAANNLIAHNNNLFTKNLWSASGNGELIEIVVAKDEEDEAEQVAALLNQHRFLHQTELSEYAILYRSNYQARAFEKALRELQIPYQLSGATSMFASTEIKDFLAYLKILVNPDDNMAFLRIINTPKREIGPATVEKLSNYAQMRNCSFFHACFELGLEQHLPINAVVKLRNFGDWINLQIDNLARGADPLGLIKDILSTINYETWLLDTSPSEANATKRYENVLDCVSWLGRLIAEENASLTEALNKILLIDLLSQQNENNPHNCVQLMTIHAAKGLEFKHVFLTGMNEDILPHHNSLALDTLEEERRLCYVAITRAKATLTISLVKQRKKFKEILNLEPSRFLEELDTDKTLTRWSNNHASQSPETRLQHGKAKLSALQEMLKQLEAT